jgi:5-methylcytosine-specific restriction endonuclease McrA
MPKNIPLTQYEGPDKGWKTYQIDPRKDYRAYLETDAWREVREAAIERANHCCERCGAEKRLQVHHKTYANLGAEKPEDLEVLCADCHLEEHL